MHSAMSGIYLGPSTRSIHMLKQYRRGDEEWMAPVVPGRVAHTGISGHTLSLCTNAPYDDRYESLHHFAYATLLMHWPGVNAAAPPDACSGSWRSHSHMHGHRQQAATSVTAPGYSCHGRARAWYRASYSLSVAGEPPHGTRAQPHNQPSMLHCPSNTPQETCRCYAIATPPQPQPALTPEAAGGVPQTPPSVPPLPTPPLAKENER